MDRKDTRLTQPALEFVNVMACIHPPPERYVQRGAGAESYLIEAAPLDDRPALMMYLADLLDGPPIDNADLRALMNRSSAWWGFETKCARRFLEGLRGSLSERMKTNA